MPRQQDAARALPVYVLYAGWYHLRPPGTDRTHPGIAVVPTFAATPSVAEARAAFEQLQQQGFDVCGLAPVWLAIEGEP